MPTDSEIREFIQSIISATSKRLEALSISLIRKKLAEHFGDDSDFGSIVTDVVDAELAMLARKSEAVGVAVREALARATKEAKTAGRPVVAKRKAEPAEPAPKKPATKPSGASKKRPAKSKADNSDSRPSKDEEENSDDENNKSEPRVKRKRPSRELPPPTDDNSQSDGSQERKEMSEESSDEDYAEQKSKQKPKPRQPRPPKPKT